jgi:transposase InsO family protein
VRLGRVAACRRDEQWAMDFMHDTMVGSVAIRILTVIDLFSRECVALVAARNFSGAQVAALPDQAKRARGTLKYGVEYRDLGRHHFDRDKQIQAARLLRRLKARGVQVSVQPAA